MFADDTTIFYKHKNKLTLEKSINDELINIANWLVANKLSLNVSKTNFLFFSNSSNKNINLILSNKPLEQKQCTKYLGIYIDENLNWSNQINNICTKISQGVGTLYKLRHLLSLNSLRNIYCSFVQSHCMYGILNWGSAKLPLLNKINKLLYKCGSILTFSNKNDGKKKLNELKLINIKQLYIS